MRSMIRMVALGHILEGLLEGFLGLLWLTQGETPTLTQAIVERTGVGFGFFLIALEGMSAKHLADIFGDETEG